LKISIVGAGVAGSYLLNRLDGHQVECFETRTEGNRELHFLDCHGNSVREAQPFDPVDVAFTQEFTNASQPNSIPKFSADEL